MPFVSPNYRNHPDAPQGTWACTRISSLGPYEEIPPTDTRHSPNFCGQCVSYVTTVCATIPVNTAQWRKGAQVRGNATIAEGTAIATFNAAGQYHGHAAIYISQNNVGMQVMDQWVTGAGKAIGQRLIKWEGAGISNNGNGFYVVEP